MGIDLWFRVNISAPRPPILKVKVLNCPIWGMCFYAKKTYFRVNQMRKSGKTEFFEVHIERAVITHLITVLFVIFCTCRMHTCAHTCIGTQSAHMPACRPSGILRSKELLISKKVSIPCCSA